MLLTIGGNNSDCTGDVPWEATYPIISSGIPNNQDGNSVLGVLFPPISQEPIQSPSSQIHSLQSSSQCIREVNVPEQISIQELSNRMAERSNDVIKFLLNMKVVATINHVIDKDTAEYIVCLLYTSDAADE